jgi:dTDP-glucose 4,6-dehydratase
LRVLVTGGAGFAGSHLAEHLLVTTDWDLVILDGLTYAGRTDRLTDAAGFDPARVTLLWHDLRAPIHSWLDDRIGPVEAVLHLAAESHVDRSIRDPVPFVTNNVAATLNVLEWARYREITHFVQVSTDEVYGPAELHAHAEWDTIRPSNPYSASKACQEAIAFSYWRTYGVPVTIVNIMNMFGERQSAEKFVPLAIKAVLAGDEVPLHGRHLNKIIAEPWTGDAWEPSSRCWLHARNFADALRWVLTDTTPAGFPQTDRPDRWHVAGDEKDVLEIAEAIAEAAGKPLRHAWVNYHFSRPGHDHRYALDASKIARAGWKAPVELGESLERTVHWFQSHPGWLT